MKHLRISHIKHAQKSMMHIKVKVIKEIHVRDVLSKTDCDCCHDSVVDLYYLRQF